MINQWFIIIVEKIGHKNKIILKSSDILKGVVIVHNITKLQNLCVTCGNVIQVVSSVLFYVGRNVFNFFVNNQSNYKLHKIVYWIKSKNYFFQ